MPIEFSAGIFQAFSDVAFIIGIFVLLPNLSFKILLCYFSCVVTSNFWADTASLATASMHPRAPTRSVIVLLQLSYNCRISTEYARSRAVAGMARLLDQGDNDD